MENHQPKSEKIPLLKNGTQELQSQYSEVEVQDPEWVSFAVYNLLMQGKSPFVITKDQKIRREQPCLTLQSDHQYGNIQDKILSYNRKDKSLMELTRKFIQKFEGATQRFLVLDKVTAQLNVERRRIYDIINIMQSLGVVQKKRKNVYVWKGLREAIEVIKVVSSGAYQEQNDRQKRQKSLESLATEFLKLFAQSNQHFTLQQSAQIILSEANQQMRKTKIRRLYDIINVFKCLGLVQKVKNPKVVGSKPAYQWLGSKNLQKIIMEKQKQAVICFNDEINCQSSSQTNKKETENHPAYAPIKTKTKSSQSSNSDREYLPFKDISNTNHIEQGIIVQENNKNIVKIVEKQKLPKQSFNLFEEGKKEKKQQFLEFTSNIAQPKPSCNAFVNELDETPSFFHNLPKLLNVNILSETLIDDFCNKLRKSLWPS